MDGTPVELVAGFVYLGSTITRDGDASKEVQRRTVTAGRHIEQGLGLEESAFVSQVGPVPVTGGVRAVLECR